MAFELNNGRKSSGNWVLRQVGMAKAPTGNVSCTLKAAIKDPLLETHCGPDIGFYESERAPLRYIDVDFSGVYEHCPGCADCCTAEFNELDMIMSGVGRKVRFLFERQANAMDASCGGPCNPAQQMQQCVKCDDEILDPLGCVDCIQYCDCLCDCDCSIFAWAEGRITSAPSKYSVDDILNNGGRTEVSFSARLDTGLRQVRYEDWIYASTLDDVAPDLPNCLFIETFNPPAYVPGALGDRNFWFYPCNLGSCCEYARWFPRQFTNGSRYTGDPLLKLAELPNFMSSAVQCQRITVAGNGAPRVFFRSAGAVNVIVTDSLGIHTYTYNQAVFSDTDSGLVSAVTLGGVLSASVMDCAVLRLEPGISLIEVQGASATWAIDPTWIA